MDFNKKLVSAGVPERQAEIHADTFRDIIDSQLYSKKDIKELDFKIETVKADLTAKIESIRKDLELKIESSKNDIIKWVAGMLIAQGAVIATSVKLLSH